MKGIHEYNRGQRRPKWKAPRGSTLNTQAKVVGRGEGVRKKLKGKKNHMKKMLEKFNNVVDDETCHVAKKMPHYKTI
jgi:hypothetical protein